MYFYWELTPYSSLLPQPLQFYQQMNRTNIVIAGSLIIAALFLASSSSSSQVSRTQSQPGLRINDPYYEQYLKIRVQPSFSEWCQLYGKVYASQEHKLYRMKVYTANIRSINEHNILYEMGKSSYAKGMNAYGDLTIEQFMEKFAWKEDPTLKAQTNACTGSIIDTPNPPAEMDWGNKVSDVGAQGLCGKDWAMVAVNAVESLYALKMGTLPTLSTQQLVECSVDYGNQGCNGGFMDQAFYYIIDNGIATQKSYPDRDSDKCRYVLNMRFTGFSKCARIPSRSYSKLLSAIVQQPVSVALDLNPEMAFYKTGLYDDKCTSTLNHAMLLVGYGGVQAQKYFWKVKNTLGVSWGMQGFMLLKRVQSDGDGKCGIQIWPSVPQNLS